MRGSLCVLFLILNHHKVSCQNMTFLGSNECSEDGDCEGSLVCGMDDFCRVPCKGQSGCCNAEMPGFCKEGEGPCGSDNECHGSLVCGENACIYDRWMVNCCSQPCIEVDLSWLQSRIFIWLKEQISKISNRYTNDKDELYTDVHSYSDILATVTKS